MKEKNDGVNQRYLNEVYNKELLAIKQKQVFRDVLKKNGITINFLAKQADIEPAKLFRCLDVKIDASLTEDERLSLMSTISKIADEIKKVGEIIGFVPDSNFEKMKHFYGDEILSMPIYKNRVTFFEYMINNGHLEDKFQEIGKDFKLEN